MKIRSDNVSDPRVLAFLADHLQDMRANSPACSVHALQPEQLLEEGVSFWTAWDGESLVGSVALKSLKGHHGEIKTMRADPERRGQGIGSALVEHVVNEAMKRGMTNLSLETGSQPFFAPARRLYARHGFIVCEPFAGYQVDPNSVYMTRKIG